MKITLNFTYIFLLVLIILTALTATFVESSYIVPMIVGLSLAKFFTVAFQFMELKNAHVFWRVLLLGFGCLVGLILILLL